MNSRRSVLVIDDEKAFGEMVVDFLRSCGYQAHAACQLEDALEQCRKQKPKIVLLDYGLPLLTGDKLISILQDIHPSLRVIVLTGCERSEVENKFTGLGYFAVVEKAGLSLERLREKIEEALAY